MNLNPFSYFKRKEKRSVSIEPVDAVGLPYISGISPLNLQTAMQLSTVYRCVEVVSDAGASQSWDVEEYSDQLGWVINPFHQIAYLINNEPSPTISRYMFMKTMIAKMLLEGNGYAIIRRDSRGDPVRLDLVTGAVTMYLRIDKSVYYVVKDNNTQQEEFVDGSEMIHLMNFTYNGYFGVSTLTHAANTMGLASSAEASATGFFASGANMSGILSVEGKVTPEKAAAIKTAWAAAFNVTDGTPGGIAVMESGLDFKPVTVNPKDAQMLETRQFNVLEICRFFGCPPPKVFDLAGTQYGNVEAYQLGFITDCVSPLDSRIEGEFNRKLLRPSQRLKTRLNLKIEDLLRANLDAKANYVSKMFQCGGFSVNEVRKECKNPLSSEANADKPMIQVNMMPVDKIGIKPDPVIKKVVEPIKPEPNGSNNGE